MKKYTHKGLFCGIFPAYLEMPTADCRQESVTGLLLRIEICKFVSEQFPDLAKHGVAK